MCHRSLIILNNDISYIIKLLGSNCTVSICMCVPAYSQLIFVRFGFFCTVDGAVKFGLGAGWAVVCFPLFDLLGTFLWHIVASGILLTDELSIHRWLNASFSLDAFLPSSSCSALLLPTMRVLTAFLYERTRRGLWSHIKHHTGR